LARFFKIAPAEILVVHDELDLPPGQMKLKQGGGNGGHNGLKDIQAQLGDGNFWRLRLGIGHPGIKGEVAAYVLRKPPADERDAIERNVEDSVKHLGLMLDGSMDAALMKIHARPPRPKPARPVPTLGAMTPLAAALSSAHSAAQTPAADMPPPPAPPNSTTP
jgi:PTH1 family peptidyl-tRNA hydrolase